MARYLIRRGLQSLALIWFSTVISFTIYQLAPGGPLQFLERNPRSGVDNVARLKRLHGLDRPVLIQYIAWLAGEDWAAALPNRERWQSGRCISDAAACSRGLLRLDFGRSFYFKGQSVIKVIGERIPATFTLALASLLLSVLIGVPLGVLAALQRGRWIDHVIRITTVLINSVPDWWLGLLLLIVLGSYLDLVPLGGMHDIGNDSLGNRLHHLILPATVGAIGGWISFSRILRFEILDVLNQDYVRTARAKGLSRWAVVTRHVLRNALMPFVTGLSDIFLLVLSGAVLFEIVFSWPGMGRLTIEAINGRDYPVLMGLLVISSFLGIMGVLLVDVLYNFVDPRVSYGEAN